MLRPKNDHTCWEHHKLTRTYTFISACVLMCPCKCVIIYICVTMCLKKKIQFL